MHALWDELGLYRGQPFLLGVLWEQEGITHSELANRMQVSPATVTNMLKRMEKAGFVERRPDAEDQRVSRVYLTGVGREIRGRVDQHWQEVEAQVFGTFSEQELETLRELLTRVQQELVRLHEGRAEDRGSPSN
jgi:DNA-binding MarR family transcriptional regulator